MMLEVLAFLGVAASNIFTLVVRDTLQDIVVVSTLLVATYNLVFYGTHKNLNPTLTPPLLITATLTHLTTSFFALPSFIVDLVLITSLLTLLSYYWDYESVRTLFSGLTPLALLAGVVLGVWVGLENPLRYCLMSFLDVTAYRLIRERYVLSGVAFCLPALLFITAYSSPFLHLNTAFLVASTLFYVAKLILSERSEVLVRHVINLDAVIKPLLAGWSP